MRGRKMSAAALLCCAAFAAGPAPSAAAEDSPFERGIFVGPFAVHPALGLRGGYESNVFHAPTSAVADVHAAAVPALTLALDRERTDLSLGGEFEELRYFGINDPRSTDQSSRSWGASSSWNQQWTASTRGALAGKYRRTRDPLLGELTLAAERSDRERWEGEAKLAQDAGTGVIQFELGYGFTRDSYDGRNRAFDRDNHVGTLELRLRPLPTFALLSQAALLHSERSRGAAAGLARSGDQLRALAGVAGSLSPAWKLLLLAGVDYSLYAGRSGALRPRGTGQFDLLPDAFTRLSLIGQWTAETGTISDELLVRRGIVEAERRLGRLFTALLRAGYWETEYLPDDQISRTDYSRQGRLRLGFKPGDDPVFDAGIAWDLVDRHSSRRSLDFRAHSVVLELGLRY